MKSLEDKLERLLQQRNYKEYNRLLKKHYGVEPIVQVPEIKGGNRVYQFDPDWFEYNDYNSAFRGRFV